LGLVGEQMFIFMFFLLTLEYFGRSSPGGVVDCLPLRTARCFSFFPPL